jgi:hypothetical protein
MEQVLPAEEEAERMVPARVQAPASPRGSESGLAQELAPVPALQVPNSSSSGRVQELEQVPAQVPGAEGAEPTEMTAGSSSWFARKPRAGTQQRRGQSGTSTLFACVRLLGRDVGYARRGQRSKQSALDEIASFVSYTGHTVSLTTVVEFLRWSWE